MKILKENHNKKTDEIHGSPVFNEIYFDNFTLLLKILKKLTEFKDYFF